MSPHEGESFEDLETATLMNQEFISIKVDREERPDVDGIYMQATVAMTGSGGWPMSVFLTPYLRPFFAGTYFPPVRRYNMPSFKEVLLNIAKAWREDIQEVDRVGNQVLEHIRPPMHKPENRNEITTEVLEAAIKSLLDFYDWGYGCWGSAPKFPQPMTIEFLPRGMDVHELSVLNGGYLFDLELSLAWKTLTGHDLELATRLWMYEY